MAITADEAKRYSAAAGDALTAERVARQRAEAERDEARAEAALHKGAAGSIHLALVQWKERCRTAEAERDAALAQVEGLRTIRSLCRGCLKPMKEHPPGPPCQPFLPGPLRAAGSALFRLVDAALSSTSALDAHPDTEVKS